MAARAVVLTRNSSPAITLFRIFTMIFSGPCVFADGLRQADEGQKSRADKFRQEARPDPKARSMPMREFMCF